MTNSIINRKYVGVTKTPLHIGSRSTVSHVNLSIARDVDLLPIITASTLRGCTRAYSFMEYSLKDCDGKGQDCPQPHVCSSCAVYGYMSYRGDKRANSLAMFSPGLMLFTPVQTAHGMIWLSSERRLRDAGIVPSEDLQVFLGTFENSHSRSIISSQMFQTLRNKSFSVGVTEFSFSVENSINTQRWLLHDRLHHIYDRCVVVQESQFGSIASNLTEVYTSISIDGKTGKAKPGALYAYEGVSRSSVFSFEIAFLDPKSQGVDRFVSEKQGKIRELKGDLSSLLEIVESGLAKISTIGIGGKRSHGFGRMDIFPTSNLSADNNSDVQSSEEWPSVFLSHSNKDKLFVRKLAKDLQVRFIRPWLDEREILVGDSITTKINEGIQNTDFMIFVISSNAVASGWVEREINAGLVREAEQRNIVLLPALIEQSSRSQIPHLLRDKKYADFTTSYDEGLHQLLQGIRCHIQRMKGQRKQPTIG